MSDNKKGSSSSDLSANDLLKKLMENIGDNTKRNSGMTDPDFLEDTGDDAQTEKEKSQKINDSGKKQMRYRFRRSSRPVNAAFTPKKEDNDIEENIDIQADADSDVQEDGDQGLDIDSLMKKYMSDDEYQKFSKPREFPVKSGEETSDRYSGAADIEPENESSTDNNEKNEPEEPDYGINNPEAAEDKDADSAVNDDTAAAEVKVDGEIAIQPEENIRQTESTGEVKPEATDEHAVPESDFDETDANLMIAFGMEDELAKTVGVDKVNQIEADISHKTKQIEAKIVSKIQKEEFEEYTSFSQTKGIFRKYKIQYKLSLIRLAAAAVLAVILFFFENIGIFGASLPAFMNPSVYPVVHIMLSLQLMLLCFALVYKQAWKGTKAIIRLKPLPESILPVVLAISLIYNIGACFFETGTVIHVYNFPIALCVLLAITGEKLNLQREIFSFNIISSKRQKYALDKLDLENAALETEAFYDYLPESPDIFKINKLGFIDGFYRKMNTYSRNKIVIKAIIPLIAVITAVTYIAALIKLGSGQQAFTAAYITFMICMPFPIFLTYSLPGYTASKTAFGMESAYIGDSALDEYTTASSISFEDRDVFPSKGVKLKSIKVFGKHRIDRIIYNTASVFSVLGGPLSDVFDIATMDIGKSDNVELLKIEHNGIEAMVDGCHLYIGKADYLRDRNYVPISDADDEEIIASGELSLMYLVIDDDVAAKIYIQYRIDPDFEYILKRMYKSGICVGIKTIDPNIDDEMLSMRIKLEKYPVRVLKCRTLNGESDPKGHTDSGIVSKHSTKALLRTFALCDKVQHITKTNIIINIFAILLGLLITAFIVGLNVVPGVYSVYICLYQLFWVIPVYIITKLFV